MTSSQTGTSGSLITDEIVQRAWDAYWDAGPASGSKRAMRLALEAVVGDIIEEFGASLLPGDATTRTFGGEPVPDVGSHYPR